MCKILTFVAVAGWGVRRSVAWALAASKHCGQAAPPVPVWRAPGRCCSPRCTCMCQCCSAQAKHLYPPPLPRWSHLPCQAWQARMHVSWAASIWSESASRYSLDSVPVRRQATGRIRKPSYCKMFTANVLICCAMASRSLGARLAPSRKSAGRCHAGAAAGGCVSILRAALLSIVRFKYCQYVCATPLVLEVSSGLPENPENVGGSQVAQVVVPRSTRALNTCTSA